MSQRKYEEFQAFCYKRKGHSIRVQDGIETITPMEYDQWAVGSVLWDNDAGHPITVEFGGIEDERMAKEYAAWMNSRLNDGILSDKPPTK